jgi:hypothetical protein
MALPLAQWLPQPGSATINALLRRGDHKPHTKDEVLAELMQEHVALKIVLGRREGPIGIALHAQPPWIRQSGQDLSKIR